MIKYLKFLFVIVFVWSGFITAQVTNTVTFNADLTDLMAEGFDPATDSIRVEGLNWDEGSVSVVGERWLFPTSDTTIYSTTLTITSAATQTAGDTARWKFKAVPNSKFVDGGWEGRDPVTDYDGHAYVFQENNAVVVMDTLVPWISVLQLGIKNKVTFQADLSSMYGSGVGFFDPTLDWIEIRGFWSDDPASVDATLISPEADRRMTPDPFIPTLYTTTLELQLPEGYGPGTTTEWKFKINPDARFSNGGWDITSNRMYTFQEDGAEVVLDPLVPATAPLSGPLTMDLHVLFQVNLVEGSRNRYDSSLIPRDQVDFVILKGASAPLGSWGGNWTAADTIAADTNGVALYDNGSFGDKVAGDYIFSRLVTFPQDITMQGYTPYKYGANYPGIDVIHQGNPLDNAAPSGQDLQLNIQDSEDTVEVLDIWPTVITSVRNVDPGIPAEYTLTQNYPNPFNPETRINYSITEQGVVSLNVYNTLGQEVMTLVNELQNAGTYEVRFDASRLTSGVYFYKLNVNGKSFTKKMMLLK